MPQRSVVYHLIPSKQCRFKGNWCFLKQRHLCTPKKRAVLSWWIHANPMIFGRFWLPHWGNKTSFMGPRAPSPSSAPQSVWLSPRASWGFRAPENGELGEPQVGPQDGSPIPKPSHQHCYLMVLWMGQQNPKNQLVDGKHPMENPMIYRVS